MVRNESIFRGTVRGKTIELDRAPALPEGQTVVVTVVPDASTRRKTPEGLLKAFGAWAEDGEELDRFMEWTRAQRKISRPPIE